MARRKLDLSIYGNILSIRPAIRFDIACLLMRFYSYSFIIGTVSMFTLSGYSAFIAGTISAIISIATFFIGPRIAKLIDERGQHVIVPMVSIVSLAGLVILILSVLFSWPLWLSYLGAVLIGFNPNAPALARTRWAYLLRTNKFGAGTLSLHSVYSYEGVLEDAGFVIAPAITIAISTTLHPVAGMVFSGCCLLIGMLVLTTARNTEPEVGWVPENSQDAGAQGDTDRAAWWEANSKRTVFMLSSTVRTTFLCLAMVGIIFGAFDTTTVVFTQDFGIPTYASFIMAYSGILSAIVGFFFGMYKGNKTLAVMLLITGTLYGVGYFTTVFSSNPLTMFIFVTVAAPFYAPFLITANSAVEKAVPGSRLTEGITWMNAGSTVGFAIGPTFAGWLMDTLGPRWGYLLVGVGGLLIPIILLIAQKRLKSELN